MYQNRSHYLKKQIMERKRKRGRKTERKREIKENGRKGKRKKEIRESLELFYGEAVHICSFF